MRLPSHLVAGATVLPSRYDFLPLLPKNGVFVEVGVATGDFSETIIAACEPSVFMAIDEFKLHELGELFGKPTADIFGSETHGSAYRKRFANQIAVRRMLVLEGDSSACLERLDDAVADVIYIDADHRYEYVKRDLEAAKRKVKPDGWIIVNDYTMIESLHARVPYGVVNATNEFMIKYNWGMQYFALEQRMFCDVVLRPASRLPPVQTQLAALAAENQALHQAIAILRGSTSWRVTAPVRAIGKLFNR
jgi:hypothetical protein